MRPYDLKAFFNAHGDDKNSSAWAIDIEVESVRSVIEMLIMPHNRGTGTLRSRYGIECGERRAGSRSAHVPLAEYSGSGRSNNVKGA